MDYGKSVILFLSFVGFCLWVGIVYKAKGEDKLNEACYPIDFSTEKLQEFTAALVGFTPQWTLGLRRYLVGGCYYFFSVILTPSDDDQNGYVVRGGVHK